MKDKEKLHKFRRKLGWVVFFGGIAADVVLSWGFLFLKPLFHLVFEICAGEVASELIGITLLKFCCAPLVWYVLLWCIEVATGYLGDY
nr:hypothetical protein [uncultured Lachnoclostridium sp.]